MVTTKTLNEPPYVADGVKKSLDKGKRKVIEGNQDRVYVITGREGSGKSTLAIQLAYYVDPTFNLKRVVFNSDDFEKGIREAEKYQAMVFDEAFNGLSSKGALSKENKRLIRLLMECRQKNLFIFIVLPSFFLLEKYVGIFRSHALFNVMISSKNFKLRYYKVYNYNQKKKLYLLGKNLMDYSRPKINKKHRFYRRFPDTINESEYEKKKHTSFHEHGIEKADEVDKYLKQRNIIIRGIKEKFNLNNAELSRLTEEFDSPISRPQISRIVNDAA